MESNRDDAERCLQLASSALAAGDIRKAQRLLEKSRRMYPLRDQQDRLFNDIQSHISKGDHQPMNDSIAPNASEQSQPDSPAAASNREPTPEMTAAVADIQRLQNKSHYDVLRLPHDCDQNDIKKSYRKLALRLHPDRNFAPGAEEAFTRVGQAFFTLSDTKRREYYERTGADEPGQLPRSNLRRRRNVARAHSAANTSFDEFFEVNDLTPEELFDLMFAASAASQRGNSFRRTQHHYPADPPSPWERLRPFVLLFLFLILTLVVSDNRPTALFSLNRSRYHTIQRETENHVTYYIPRNLVLSLKLQKRLEREVDFRALDEYKVRCAGERDRKYYLWRQSQRWFTTKTARARYKEKYENFEQPWCRRTQELQQQLRSYW